MRGCRVGFNCFTHCKAGGIRQLDIEQHKTWLEFLDYPQCLGAGLRLDHLISAAFEDAALGVAPGVVIVDKGIILTNLHVVAAAKRVGVVFADGTESEASVMSTQPENDLAVLQAHTLPDDLVAATLRSTADLLPGC